MKLGTSGPAMVHTVWNVGRFVEDADRSAS